MLASMVILAYADPGMADRVERALCLRHPAMRVERTHRGSEILMLQSIMRADAVLLDMNLPDTNGIHLIHELKRDIANPYVMACSTDRSGQTERQVMRMGANSYHSMPVDVIQVCDQLEMQLSMRQKRGCAPYGMIEEAMLQRVFRDWGISCDLKGYGHLKHALQLLVSGESSLDSMRMLYGRIGERSDCSAQTVEHNIRYVVQRCGQHTESGKTKLTNRAFIALLLEECRSGSTTLVAPRVSLFTGGRRVFR